MQEYESRVSRSPVAVLIAALLAFLWAPGARADWYDDYDFESKGVIAFWPLDGDSLDRSGNDNNGTWTNGSYVTGRFGQARQLAPGHYYTVPAPPQLATFSEITMSAWYRASAPPPENESLIGIGIDGAGPQHFYLFLFGGGTLVGPGVNGHSSTGGINTGANAPIYDGSWHLLTATWNGSVSRVYVDDMLLSENPSATGTVTPASGQSLYLNRHNWAWSWSSRLAGQVDDPVIFDHALSPTEVAALASDANGDGIADFWDGAVPYINWVALGDSYSSGESAGAYCRDTDSDDGCDENTHVRYWDTSLDEWVVNACNRSERAYSQVFQNPIHQSRVAQRFYACSGAESRNVVPSPGGVPLSYGRTNYFSPDDVPQLDRPVASSTLVTLTLGGNDLGFAKIVEDCFFFPDCQTRLVDGAPAEATYLARIASARAAVSAALDATRAKVGTATPIVLLGYPRLFPQNGPPDACANDYFNGDVEALAWPPGEQQWLNCLAEHLNLALCELSSEHQGVSFVDVVPFFSGHEICTEDLGPGNDYFTVPCRGSGTGACPGLIDYWEKKSLFHPNERGQRFGYRAALESFWSSGAAAGCSAILGRLVTLPGCLGDPRIYREPSLAFAEDFDQDSVPELPSGWTSTIAAGSDGIQWVTSNAGTPNPPAHSLPNAVFVNDPGSIHDKRLQAPAVFLESEQVELEFWHNFDLEGGFDGGVLEAAIGAAGFEDVLSLGGVFAEGGYTGTISSSYGNPLGGRSAWTGNSGGFIRTRVLFPGHWAGQHVVLRFRMGSDSSVAKPGWRVDSLSVLGSPTEGATFIDLDVQPSTYSCDFFSIEPGSELVIHAGGFSPATTAILELDTLAGSMQLGEFTSSTLGEVEGVINLPSGIGTGEPARLRLQGIGYNGHSRYADHSFGVVADIAADSDGDSHSDLCDNCAAEPNAGQEDLDGDGVGDLCDSCPFDASNDVDLDGRCADEDPCPFDPDDDLDGDGVCVPADNCPSVANANQLDTDGDLVGDICDLCEGAPDVHCPFADTFESGAPCRWSEVVGFLGSCLR